MSVYSLLLTGTFFVSFNFCLAISKLGELSTKSHGVSGTVYIIDEKKIFISGFSYDGEGPDAYFYVGTDTSLPNDEGTLVPYPSGSNSPLGIFSKTNITLTLPEDVETSDLRWLSVWCKKFSVNFGDLIFPHDLMYIDDGDNNSNNNDAEDEDDYSNHPENHEDHHPSGDSNRSSARALLSPSLIIFGSLFFAAKRLFH